MHTGPGLVTEPWPLSHGVGVGEGAEGGGGTGRSMACCVLFKCDTASSIYFLLGDPNFFQRRNFSELSGKTVN